MQNKAVSGVFSGQPNRLNKMLRRKKQKTQKRSTTALISGGKKMAPLSWNAGHGRNARGRVFFSFLEYVRNCLPPDAPPSCVSEV